MSETTQNARARAEHSRQSGVAINKEVWDADARFYLAMAAVSAAIIFAGFAPSFYLKSLLHAPPPLSLLTIVHGVVFTGWVALFIAQAALVTNRRADLHRQLGGVGAVLFGAMVTLGYWVAIEAARLGHAPPGAPAPLNFSALPILAMTAAAILVLAALWNRQDRAWHKRLMLSSLFIMTGPGTGRIAVLLGFAPQASQIAIIVAELLLATAIIYDYRQHGRVQRSYLLAVGIFATFHIGVTWAFTSPAWADLAGALTRG